MWLSQQGTWKRGICNGSTHGDLCNETSAFATTSLCVIAALVLIQGIANTRSEDFYDLIKVAFPIHKQVLKDSERTKN